MKLIFADRIKSQYAGIDADALTRHIQESISPNKSQPTISIGAKGSSFKGLDDYCDGVDDHKQLQRAIDALPATGGRISLSAGEFVGKKVTINKSYVTVEGQGISTIYKIADGTNDNGFYIYKGAGVENRLDFCRMQNFNIVGNKANQTSTGDAIHAENTYQTWIHGVWIFGAKQKGIHFASCSSGWITQCFFSYTNFGEEFICLDGASHECCIVGNDGGYAGQDTVSSGIYVGPDLASVLVAHNGLGLCKKHGIEFLGTRGRIIGNDSEHNDQAGIYIGNNNNIVNDNIVESNSRASAGAWSGITWAANKGYCTVIGNRCLDLESPKTQNYGIEEPDTGGSNTIIGNNVLNNLQTSGIKSAVGGGSIVRNNKGHVTENSGTATGTGAEQLVAHGLAFTPTRQQIALFAGSATANPYHSSDPDATNIKVTAANQQPWYWARAG